MVSVYRDRARRVRVEDDDIRVGTGCNDALLRKESEHPRRCSGHDVNPTSECDLSLFDTLIDQTDAVLDPRQPVGDLREVAETELLLILEAEGTVVGRDNA